MLHLANDYIRNSVITGHSPQVSSIPLQTFTPQNIARVKEELEKDSLSYLYSSMLSFIDALNGLKQGFYSWPTVKLYYSVFYALRAHLGFHKICLFYVGNKAFSIDLNTETNARKEKGTTHKAVLDLFKRKFPDHILLTQDIDQQHPFEWLTSLREVANYKQPKFCEPDVPEHFSKIESLCLESALHSYIKDDEYLLTFDHEHACVAYPLKLLKLILTDLVTRGLKFEEADMEHLCEALEQIGGAIECFSELAHLE